MHAERHTTIGTYVAARQERTECQEKVACLPVASCVLFYEAKVVGIHIWVWGPPQKVPQPLAWHERTQSA